MKIDPKSLAKAAYARLPLKQALFERLRGLGLPRNVYQHLHFEGRFTVRIDESRSFSMHAFGDVLENELFWRGLRGSWEQTSVEAWRRLAEASRGYIVDVGANSGTYSLLARACNGAAAVVAFEPVKRIAHRLRRNVDLNGFDILIEAKAVSEKSGSVILYDAPGENNYTASIESGHGVNDRSYPVDAVSLDNYFGRQGWPPVSLVKLDVETHEPAAMRGMVETIRRFRPAILLEVLDSEAGRRIATTIEGFGYRMFNIDEAGGLIPTNVLQSLGGENWNNLLCTQEQFDAAGLAGLLRDSPAADRATEQMLSAH